MSLDPISLASRISAGTGFAFSAEGSTSDDGHQQISLIPAGHEQNQTFAICITLLWRRLRIEFLPGRFAMPLLEHMFAADADGRSTFQSVFADCVNKHAAILLQINGAVVKFDDPAIWNNSWHRLSLSLVRGNIALGADEGHADFELASEWTLRFAAGVLALLPLEPAGTTPANELPLGFPEGSCEVVQVNRYERDRRNRAAALAIHGTRCCACELDFGERYGPIGNGFIEVHHVTPVSKLGPGYVVDPKTDLVPLCSNCHRIAHRTDPPLTAEAIAQLINSGAKAAEI